MYCIFKHISQILTFGLIFSRNAPLFFLPVSPPDRYNTGPEDTQLEKQSVPFVERFCDAKILKMISPAYSGN